MSSRSGSQPKLHAEPLVARPLPAPASFDADMRRRWALFAPALAACLREAVQRACEALYDEVDSSRSDERRRLAFASASELAGRVQNLDALGGAALEQLFVDPGALGSCWQTRVGAFALEQCGERLQRGHGDALAGLHRRLHGHDDASTEASTEAMAAELAGLLANTFATQELSAHARNVLCTVWTRRMEGVLPGLAGAQRRQTRDGSAHTPLAGNTTADDAGPRRVVPRPILDALTRAQLQGLEGPTDTDLGARIAGWLAASRVPFDAEPAERALLAIRSEVDAITRLAEVEVVPTPVRRALLALLPVLARVHSEYAAPHPAVRELLLLLLGATLDLEDDPRDPRQQLLEDVAGDVLARFRGDVADLVELTSEAREQLAQMRRRQLELRRRSRDRALLDRRREHAGRAAERICVRLAERRELVPFIDRAWRDALCQAHMRHGPDSVPWRRMLALGEKLRSGSPRDIRGIRPRLADALSLTLRNDAVEVEATLDELIGTLRAPLVDAADKLKLAAAEAVRPERARDDLPWLFADGQRRWLMVQARDGGGEILMTDALGRNAQWIEEAAFEEAVASGAISLLEPEALLEFYENR